MGARVVAYLFAVALVAGVAGCGDTNDTNIFFGATPTPDDGRTPTPGRTSTAVATATAEEPTPAATVIATATAAASATVVGATPTASPTPARTATPAPTATPQGSVDADVQRIAADIVPFLGHTDLLTGGSVDALTVVQALKTDGCPDGGSRLDDEGFPARTLTFEACRVADELGSFEFNGTVVITLGSFDGGSIAFDFTLTDLATSHGVAFLGTLSLTVDNDGFILNGPLAVSTPEGNFTLNADDVTITANRKIVSGAGSITDDADNFGLQTVAFVVTRRGASSNLTVTFDDSAVHTYTLDLATGELAQTS